jgi:DNA-binding transcriptional ArsR family regulator
VNLSLLFLKKTHSPISYHPIPFGYFLVSVDKKRMVFYYMSNWSYNKIGGCMSIQNDLCDCRVIHQERVIKASETALDADIIETLSQTFKVLGDGTRLRILWALEQEEMCVCDLAALLKISESAVSHQLRLLRNLRLVTSRREGPVQYYSLVDEHVSHLVRVALEHVNE